ncbi:MAG: DEAD/DEAH box helicase, partial [Cyanobacteria bacterium REEB67]|nr:DEAD/DEAH box helicase [Cyanobacteria bacterium REEB67]
AGARAHTHWTYRVEFPIMPSVSSVLIERMIATGRCFWGDLKQPIKEIGPTKEAKLNWDLLDHGSQILKFHTDSTDDIVVLAGGAWHVNPSKGLIGPISTELTPDVVACILRMPQVAQQEAGALAEAMERSGIDIPRPVSKYKIKTEVVKPTPRLLLKSSVEPGFWQQDGSDERSSVAMLSFDYGGIKFDCADNTESRRVTGDEILVQKRDLAAERRLSDLVEQYNLGEAYDASLANGVVTFESYVDDTAVWIDFIKSGVAELEQQGFVVEIDDSLEYKIVTADDDWEVETTSGSDFWFSFDLGVMVDGKRVPLLPAINRAIKHLQGIVPHLEIDELNVNGKFYAPLPDGQYIELPFERVKAVVQTLLEIFDRPGAVVESAAKVSLPQIMQLAPQFARSNNALLEKINNFDGLKTITPPSTFKAELRPYQLEGLSWLDFIREFGLGGILADDMGLGKTIQTLAHIACEKKAKRAKKPYLVVCPTSVLPNWMSEIKKFAPNLKSLALSGLQRAADFSKISRADIVVTTYPLVPRDIDILREQDWQAVILDEAQYIKNPLTQVAQAVQFLRSDYRLCLTGTPIENHLTELWSQYNFLMPGFLSDLKTFNKTVRTPIEKQNDAYMQKILKAKVSPFLLRRTKELVAKDLPEKTVITKSVELEGAQRDLYETVRLAMYEKVQDALAEKGLARSQIVILDALLKLRQVCCDPRLVNLPSAKKVKTSAKLEQLLEMIDELVSEGKRILLFSQFTSMLDLIEPELNEREIEFVQIRGDTKDRATPVKLFQAGSVPVFLLSLKAGGTGLNLTAADTVIHYDPWWNPAVENQATDRAHRIGQRNKVFVFRLIAAGTIEEKMIEMQEKKRAIANAIYGDEEAIASKLTAEDLADLFKPLG